MTYPDTLDEFSANCASACDDVDDHEVHALFMVEDSMEDGVLVVPIMADDDPQEFDEAVEILFLGSRRFAGLASRVGWSPDESPTTLAWCLTTVESNQRAQVHVRRVEEDERWWQLKISDTPWFALSTAGSLRAKLRGERDSLTFRSASDSRLLSRPDEGTPPPKDGLL